MTTDRRDTDGPFGNGDDYADDLFAALLTPAADDTVTDPEAPSAPTQSKSAEANKRSAEVWVAIDDHALPGFGKIMLSRPPATTDASPSKFIADWHNVSVFEGRLGAGDPRLIRNIAVSSGLSANDNVVWVGQQDSNSLDGVYGRDPSVGSLPNGDTLVAWVGLDNIVHAKLYPGPASGDDDTPAPDPATHVLNKALADLGAASAEHVSALSMVKVVADGQKSLTAVWTTEFGLTSVLMGKILNSSAAAGEAAAAVYDPAPRTPHDFAPLPVAKFNGSFSVGAGPGGGFAITYQVLEGDAVRDVTVSVGCDGESNAHLLGSNEADMLGSDDGMVLTPSSGHTTKRVSEETAAYDASDQSGGGSEALLNAGPDKNDDTGAAASEDVAVNVAGLTAHDSFSVAGTATDNVVQTDPVVVVTADGTPIVLSISQGPEPDIGTLAVSRLLASGPPVTITNNALLSETDNPAANVKAALSAVDEGFAVAWVEAVGDGGDHNGGNHNKELRAQVYDDHGMALSDAPVVIMVSDDPRTTYSDLAIGSSTRDEDHGSSSDTDTSYVVVACVKNEGEDGYGAIMAQVFAVEQDTGDGPRGLVAVGRDYVSNGDGDAAFQLNVNDADVVGRAPQLAGLDDGSIAVAWVQETASGSGVGVVHGLVLSPAHDAPPFYLDLTAFMPTGIAGATNPILLNTADGDIIVSWLQAAMAGGFEADAAIFRAAGHGQWTPPTAAVVLSQFAELPKDFSVTVTGGDDPSLIVVWRDNSDSISGVRFDVDSGEASGAFGVHHESGGGAGDANGLGVAALNDGSFIVVYADRDGTDVDIRARVYDTGNADAPGSGSSTEKSDTDNQSGTGLDSDLGYGNNYGPDPDGLNGQDSADAVVAIELDFSSDTIRLACSTDAGTAAHDGGGPSADDVTYAISVLSELPAYTSGRSGQERGESGPSGTPGNASDMSSGGEDGGQGQDRNGAIGDGTELAANDNLTFYNGYGNDAADFVTGDDLPADLPDPITTMFEALQFANALNEMVNEEVLTFDASNVVTLRDMNSLTGTQDL